ncbi:hypothetical protein CBL_20079 [Carabus blaptoides fortunei]
MQLIVSIDTEDLEGAQILVKRNIHHYRIPTATMINLDATLINLELTNNKQIILAAVYITPDRRILESDLDQLLVGTKPTTSYETTETRDGNKSYRLHKEDNSLWRMCKILRKKTQTNPRIHSERGIVFRPTDQAEAFADNLEKQFSPTYTHADIDFIGQVHKRVRRILQRKRRAMTHITLHDQPIPWTNSVKNLGFLLTPKMTLKEHISESINKAIGARIRLALDAPWFVRNDQLHADINLPTAAHAALKKNQKRHTPDNRGYGAKLRYSISTINFKVKKASTEKPVIIRVYGYMPAEKCTEVLETRLNKHNLNIDTNIVAIVTNVLVRVEKLLQA